MAIRKGKSKPSPGASGGKRVARPKPEASAHAARKAAEPVPDPYAPSERSNAEGEVYPIAAIGASAGGLEAFSRLIAGLPADAQLSFILIQHLAPNHQSMLQELIARLTPLPVLEARDGMMPDHGTVYVMPPNVIMTLEGGVLRLRPRPETGLNMPVDLFFRSMAEDQPHRSIAIVLSGAGSDGALGLQEVKAAGGITFAQEPKTAKFDGMPVSAASTGAVDFILPPEQIAAELARICHQYRSKFAGAGGSAGLEVGQFSAIFAMLRRACGVDFTQYKQSTIQRRILRRMLLERIETLAGYVEFLRENPAEVHSLYRDLLIKVTGFFRDLNRNPEREAAWIRPSACS